MKIQCDNCAILHELDPPAWVISSGRPFRFRCSSCGHSQSVMPDSLAEDTPMPAQPSTAQGSAPQPAAPIAPAAPEPATPRSGPPSAKPEGSEGAVFLKQNGQIYMVRDWETLKRWIGERRVDRHDLVSEGGVRWEPIGSRPDLLHLFGPTLAPHADDVEADSIPAPAAAVPEPTPAPVPSAPLEPPTAAPFDPPAPEPVQLGGDMPFGHEMPFMGASTGMVLQGAWHDDDTEGIPTGLPALPRQLGPNSGRERTGETAPISQDEDPEDAFGDNPSYALPPPSSDPMAETPVGAARGSGGMMYSLPAADDEPDDAGSDSPIPAPSPSDVPTAPPPAVPVPSAFGNQPKGDDGWDPLMVAEDSSPGAPSDFNDVPTVAEEFTPSDVFDDDELSWPAAAQRSLDWRVGAAAFFGLAIVLLLVGLGIRQLTTSNDLDGIRVEPDAELNTVLDAAPSAQAEPADTPAPEPEPEPEPEAEAGGAPEPEPEGTPEPEASPEAVPAPQPDPEPAPEPAPEPTPSPAPAPAPPPAPAPEPRVVAEPPTPVPQPTNLATLIDQGWNSVESDPATARKHFARALEIYDAHAEANYGYGYAQLQLGNTADARGPLCTALKRGSQDVRREVAGLLERHGLSCDQE